MSVRREFCDAKARAPGETRALVTGMVINIVLTVFKFVIGTATHSAALIADGYKDMSEAVRTVLRIVLSHMRRDVREHKEKPAAAVRTEQILSVIVAFFLIYLGLKSIAGSYRDALDDHETSYTAALIIITAASIAAKAFMAHYKFRLGRRIHNEDLAEDASGDVVDCIIAGTIMAGAVIDHTLSVDIDTWVGYIIGAIIIFHAAHSLLKWLKKFRPMSA